VSAAFLGLLLSLAAAGQPQAAASHIVLVTATVSGRSAVDLGVDDFVVEEGGVARDIIDVHIADYPIVVLIDNGAETAAEIDVMREAAARFVSRVGERGIAVGTLADPAAMVASFDDDRAKVLLEIRRVPQKPAARLAPLDAVASAARMLHDTGSPFAAVVIISARAMAPAELASADLLAPILDSRVAVHVIGRRPAAAAEPDSSAQPVPDVFRELATVTHGQYTTIYSPASYAIALDRLADRLATEMMIQFLAPPDRAAGGEVRVGVKIPGARVTGLGVSR
jgi:hypothetical protein